MEEFADYGSMKDSVFVRIANIPLQESIRDLRCGCQQQLMRVIEAQCGKSMPMCDAHFGNAHSTGNTAHAMQALPPQPAGARGWRGDAPHRRVPAAAGKSAASQLGVASWGLPAGSADSQDCSTPAHE